MSNRILTIFLYLLVYLPFSVRAGVGDNSVGMNIHIGRASFIDACADLGVGWVRMDGNWFVLEPAQDSYNWSWMDEFVTRAHDAGLKVFLTLGYTPDWVPSHSQPGESPYNPGDNCPDDSTHWIDFVEDAVTHYRAMGVTHFGLWNEPNLDGFFDGTLDEYVDIIMVPGAEAVRQVCSDCKVLGPELANVGDCDVYLEGIFDRAPATTFDIITHHTYNGFTETGWYIWDGDGFINVLDDQRIPGFTRKDIRQILDAAGWTGEVWITETGYRADPPGDAGEENLQAIYYTRVLEEQLARAWYTNSFFYEIMDCRPDQPTCDIDGFGIMRAVSGTPGNRTFPDDFRLKPAFHALKQFIVDHPEITGTEPPPQCGDGEDNDGDGMTDLADRGCTDSLDDNEADDPPRARMQAYRTPGMVVDGDHADVGPDGWLNLGESSWRGTEPLAGPGDLSVRAAVRWSADGLFVAVEVTDDIHDNSEVASDLWKADSLQLGFDTAQNGGLGYDSTDDHEINFGLSGGQSLSFRFHGPAVASDDFEVAVMRAGQVTSYEVRLAPSALPGATFAAGSLMGFSFLVNENDGNGRLGWIEWTAGIGAAKAPEYFGEILLLNESSGGPGEDGGPDAGADAGWDGGEDGGTLDGGSDPGQNPDTDRDAGTDAGSDPGTDAGADTGGGPDAGPGDQDQPGDPDDGCGCSSGSPDRGLPLLLLLALGGLLLRRPGRFLLLLAALVLTGCGLDVIEITITEEGQTLPAGVTMPGIGSFGSSLTRELSSNDVNPGDVDSMRLLSCAIELTSQGGALGTNDLAFLQKLEFWVEATGQARTLLAEQPSFPEGTKLADLWVEPDLELKPFLDAGDMQVDAEAPLVYPPPDGPTFEVRFRIRVDVNL